MKKAKCQKIHFKKRMKERYNFVLSNVILKKFVHVIQHQQSLYAMCQSRTRSIHFILYENIIIPVVYDKTRKNVVTALPRNKYSNIIQAISKELKITEDFSAFDIIR